MKKIFALVFTLTLSGMALAQDLVEMVKRDINAERRTIVAEAMDIPAEREVEFWQTYNELEKELGILMDRRVSNINKFAENYDNITDDIAHELSTAYFDIHASRIKLYKSYYKKLTKIIGTKESARFVQLLGQIQLIIDMQVAAELPLIN